MRTVSPFAATDTVSAPVSTAATASVSPTLRTSASAAASATIATVPALAIFDVLAIVPILFLCRPEAWPPPCLPGARERSAERGAAIGEHGRAARQARWIGRIGRVKTMRRLARARPCHRTGGSRGGEMAETISPLHGSARLHPQPITTERAKLSLLITAMRRHLASCCFTRPCSPALNFAKLRRRSTQGFILPGNSHSHSWALRPT